LTDEEFVEMRRHTVYGATILDNSEIELLRVSKNIAGCHHEKFDGTGYPNGLKGEEIPLEARIVSVADVLMLWLANVFTNPVGMKQKHCNLSVIKVADNLIQELWMHS